MALEPRRLLSSDTSHPRINCPRMYPDQSPRSNTAAELGVIQCWQRGQEWALPGASTHGSSTMSPPDPGMLQGQLGRQMDTALTQEQVALMGHQQVFGWDGRFKKLCLLLDEQPRVHFSISESPRDPADVEGSVREGRKKNKKLLWKGIHALKIRENLHVQR